MIVCLCHGVTEKDLENSITPTEPVLEKLQSCTGAGTDCGSCLAKLQEYVERRKASGSASRAAELGSSQSQSSK